MLCCRGSSRRNNPVDASAGHDPSWVIKRPEDTLEAKVTGGILWKSEHCNFSEAWSQEPANKLRAKFPEEELLLIPLRRCASAAVRVSLAISRSLCGGEGSSTTRAGGNSLPVPANGAIPAQASSGGSRGCAAIPHGGNKLSALPAEAQDPLQSHLQSP